MKQTPNQPENQSKKSKQLDTSNKSRPKFYAHLVDSTPSIWQSRLDMVAKHRKTAVTAAVGLFLGFSLAIAKIGFANEEKLNLDTVYSDAAINSEVQQRMSSCQQGGEGTVGQSMATALKIHQDFASITPPVEKMFNESGCFDKLNKLVDLSVAIPSISSIAASLTNAVLDAAKKKACKAVSKASDMLADPINAGLQKINGYTDLNGLANRTISEKLSQVDPNLGAGFVYTPPDFETSLRNMGRGASENLDSLLEKGAASLSGNHQANIQGMQSTAQAASAIKSPVAEMEKARQDAYAYNYSLNRDPYNNIDKPRISEQQIQQTQSGIANNALNSVVNLAAAQNTPAPQNTIAAVNANTANSTGAGKNTQADNKGGFSSNLR